MWLRFRKKLFLGVPILVIILLIYNKEESLSKGKETSKTTKKNRDIHVVIGYYQGNNLPWLQGENLTDELLNANMFSPDPSAGKDGAAVIIPPFTSPQQKKLFLINRFNLMASDRIPLNRSLPDVRRKSCQIKKYPENLPKTSIIIVFHNEAWSTLMRTVVSVLERSPQELIEDFILVDDASQRDFLRKPLETATAALTPKIKIIRSPNRIGLIRARLLGAEVAKGEVLTFLDAHCEVSKGWLSPLLNRVKQNDKTIASPVIDIINDETFQYIRSFELHQGAFNWALHFRWFSLPSDIVAGRQDDPTEPFVTPVMAGGLFSINKDFFYKLGAYDEQMQIWGGENLEISFRGWLCGATLEIVPCSHVGHLFRKSSPYTFPGGVGDVLNSNLARVALVWMDEWKEFFFKLHPEVAAFRNQSVSARLQLKTDLNCKNFSYFLNNIWPQNFFPSNKKFFGRIRSKRTEKCLQTPETKTFGQPYGAAAMATCILELYAPQLFVYSDGFLKTDDNVCLDVIEDDVRIMACSGIKRQRFEIDVGFEGMMEEGSEIKHLTSGRCVVEGEHDKLVLRDCGSSVAGQWLFQGVDWK